MEFKYYCPKCNALLNPSFKVIFKIKHEGKQCLILLDPNPGDYTKFHADEIKLKKGDIWDFHCPVCDGSLSVDKENNMAMIKAVSRNDKTHKFVFSTVVDVYASFVVDDDNITSYGDDSITYEYLIKNKYF